MGATFMSYTTDVERGVLNVPGGLWSLMIHRSADWPDQRRIFANGYEREIDRQLIIVLSQAQWDFADPITTCPHLADDPSARHAPSPRRPAGVHRRCRGHEPRDREHGAHDWRALLAPSVRDVWGSRRRGPGRLGAVGLGHRGPIENPAGNVPAPDNDAHGAIRRLPSLIEQMRRFFTPDGRVEHTCDGPCDPE